MRWPVAILLIAGLVVCASQPSGSLTAAPPAQPPMQQPKAQMLGPGQCLNCHDHDKEKDWYNSKELLEVVRLFPDKGKNAGHVNSMNQLESPKSDAYAKAVGQADKYDVNGICVRCHATVFNGDANAGVSCESCHGPASAYLQPHQVKGSYDTAVTQYGMTRLVGNIQGWTQQCTNCHVMDDDRLIKAGHPSGDDFDLSKRYQPVSLHFKKTYTPEQVGAIAKNEMAGIIMRRRPNQAPPPLVPTESVSLTGGATSLGAPPPAPPPATVATTPIKPQPEAAPATPPPAAAAPKPATPKPAVPKAAAAAAKAVEDAHPPAGSPTSIEPPAPPPSAAPTPAAPAAPAASSAPPAAPPAPPAADAGSSMMSGPLPWIGGAVLLAVLAAVVMMRRKA